MVLYNITFKPSWTSLTYWVDVFDHRSVHGGRADGDVLFGQEISPWCNNFKSSLVAMSWIESKNNRWSVT
ncbi:hypothetical protein MLD38_027669 [Melastoma candidum]|uniref:Uncharacterized protein n=1 Tax=Melastoma candidum TaxID=119954 RepID=A0ACB9P3I3_9MYRT|nr:hypothetical protein MLD38_027669 [Melastoma candidum]